MMVEYINATSPEACGTSKVDSRLESDFQIPLKPFHRFKSRRSLKLGSFLHEHRVE